MADLTTGVGSRTHFKGLTELRAVAACAVVVSHTDQFQEVFGNTPVGISETGIAGHAVTTFFVLSGFLITYLLCQEVKTTGALDIKKFYVRRILRIWPVYYLALLLGIVQVMMGTIAGPSHTSMSVGLYAFMLPNVAYASEIAIRTVTPLWSVGVEEQFYLIWPWVVRMRKNLERTLVIIIISYLAARIVVNMVDPSGGLYALLYLTRIDCMAIGGMLACVHIRQHLSVLRVIHHPICQGLAVTLMILPLLVHLRAPFDLEVELYALASGVVILNLASNPRSLIRSDIQPLHFLGTISYGLYAYHLIVLFALRPVLFGKSQILIHVAVFIGTVVLAYLSYRFMEQPALRRKDRFAVVRSSS